MPAHRNLEAAAQALRVAAQASAASVAAGSHKVARSISIKVPLGRRMFHFVLLVEGT
jgi:hypothetical protein